MRVKQVLGSDCRCRCARKRQPQLPGGGVRRRKVGARRGARFQKGRVKERQCS